MDEISIDDRERTKKKKQKVIIEEKKRDPDGKKKGKRRIRVRGCHRKISRHDCESRGRRKRIRVLKRRDEPIRTKKSGESWSCAVLDRFREENSSGRLDKTSPPSISSPRGGKFEK